MDTLNVPTNSSDELQRTERRHKLAELLVVVLFGVAFAEMVRPVWSGIRDDGIHWETVSLFLVFFFTSIRFFIGCQLHLLSEDILQNGRIWFYDLMCIIIEMTLLIFLGSLSSVAASRSSEIGFLALLFTLYAFDVVWIASQVVLGALFPSWARTRRSARRVKPSRFFSSWRILHVPWEWAVLNVLLIFGIAVLIRLIPDVYSTPFLIGLVALNGIGFVIDVVLTDVDNLI